MNKRSLICGAALAALAWCAPVAAQDNNRESERTYRECLSSLSTEDVESGTVDCFAPYIRGGILVAGSRTGSLQFKNYLGSATVLTAEVLGQRQVRDIADALRDVPGVSVSSVAGQTQLRLRGSEANHVLVLVDGIEVSDPFAGEFDIGTLQAEIGARVEVLRGPQSALYGSDAIGGIVAYDSGRFDGAAAWLEGGSNGTLNGSARAGARGDRWHASLSGVVVSTDGEPNARGGTRDIGRDSYTLAGKGAMELAPDFELRAVARFIRTEGDFNDSDFDTASPTFGFVIDSPATRFTNEAIYALFGVHLETLAGDWTHDLSGQTADIARDTFGPFGRTSGSDGDRLKLSYVSSLTLGHLGKQHSLTLAADWERERFRNDDPFDFAFTGRHAIENVGLAAEYRYAGRDVDFSAAIRHDINDRFADATTFRLGAGYDLGESTRLRGAWGNGIKNPGFYELYGYYDGQFIGNPDLRPEKSQGWELGLDKSLAGDAVRLSATWFNSRLTGEIYTTYPAPDYVATPANRTTRSTQRGLELSARARLGRQVALDLAYSWLDAEEAGVEEVRRPGNIASAALTWTAPHDAVSAALVVRHNGASNDLAFTDPTFIPVTVRLDDYTLVNFNAETRLTRQLTAFGRIENLLDERYEQVFSFVSSGRSATLGLRAKF